MTLAEYMKTAGETDATIADKVGRDRSSVTRWRLGRTKPDFDALVALERASKGLITARDFVEQAA